jgi:hypothetical protein
VSLSLARSVWSLLAGLLYFGSAKIHALNATTGAPVWEFPVINFAASSPVLGPSGILYVGGTSGRLWAITGTVVNNHDSIHPSPARHDNAVRGGYGAGTWETTKIMLTGVCGHPDACVAEAIGPGVGLLRNGPVHRLVPAVRTYPARAGFWTPGVLAVPP